MMKWEDAPEVKFVAEKLIMQYHKKLIDANIKYLFRSGNWKLWAQVTRTDSLDKFLTGYDFYLMVNKDVWCCDLHDECKFALIDHELCHCDRDADGSWRIIKHDLEDFIAVVARHGAWTKTVKKYLTEGNKEKGDKKGDRVLCLQEIQKNGR